MIYLDNAATTYPKPNSVVQNMKNAFSKYGSNPGRSGHQMSMDTAEKIFNCREIISDMFSSGSPLNVIFTMNCTMSLNMAIKGVLSYGDHVITTQLEHNSVLRPLAKLEHHGFIKMDMAKVYPGEPKKTVNEISRLIRPKTKLIVMTSASNVWGILTPIQDIGQLAHENEIIFIVDAAQSAGTEKINMEESNIDILCMPGHKGLYGPPGTGIMLTKQHMNTIIEGGTGTFSENNFQPDQTPERFESGTINTVGIIGLYHGIKFVKETGEDDIFNHELDLVSRLYDNLKSMNNIDLYTEHPKKLKSSPIVSFNIKNTHSEEVTNQLGDMDFVLRGGYHCSYIAHKFMHTEDVGVVRASPSIFNIRADIDKLVDAVYKISKQ